MGGNLGMNGMVNNSVQSGYLYRFPTETFGNDKAIYSSFKNEGLRHSEEFRRSRRNDEESKNEILRLAEGGLRMTKNSIINTVSSISVVPEKQIEKQADAVRLFECYI